MQLPPSLEQLIRELKKLPTIGEKSAQRLAFHLLERKETDCRDLAEALVTVANTLRHCERCHNISDHELCQICELGERGRRDISLLCIVEQPGDILAFERTGAFQGLYHVLGGSLSPAKGVNPQDLNIDSLFQRLSDEPIREVILATNPNLEGEATGLYLSRKLQREGLSVTRLAYGLPMGTNLEYTDTLTLSRALSGRSRFGEERDEEEPF